MWLFYSNSNDVKRVPDGRREAAKCGACGKAAIFYECEAAKSFNLYVVLPIWSEKKRVMQCGECLAACPIEEFEQATKQASGAAQSGKTSSPNFSEDFGKGFQRMTESIAAASKGVMGKLDQFTFKMLVDNLKSNDQQVVLDTIEQLEKENKPMGIAPLFFVSRNHPGQSVRERAARALNKLADPAKLEKLTAGKSSEEATKALILEFGHYKSG